MRDNSEWLVLIPVLFFGVALGALALRFTSLSNIEKSECREGLVYVLVSEIDGSQQWVNTKVECE